MFMSMQGYTIKNNVLYQDNQSTILMLKNGRNSCTGNSRHIHIRYFFVKDRVDKKEVKIEYCPSLNMLADFFTKPLQGQLFLKFKQVLMGHEPLTTLKWKRFCNQGACWILGLWLKNIFDLFLVTSACEHTSDGRTCAALRGCFFPFWRTLRKDTDWH